MSVYEFTVPARQRRKRQRPGSSLITVEHEAPSILFDGVSWRSLFGPSQDALDGAVLAFRGGYVYWVSDAVAEALDAGGFGAGLTPPWDVVPGSGYGFGPYGHTSYGG